MNDALAIIPEEAGPAGEIEELSGSLEKISDDLGDDALVAGAVAAWRRLRDGGAAGASPSDAELLDRGRRQAACRLSGAGEGGTAVIAVRRSPRAAAIERTIHERVLPRLALPAARWYGTAAEPAGSAGGDAEQSGAWWMFIEEVDGAAFQPADPTHRSLAARWLAELHVGSARVADECGTLRLPEQGVGFYAAHLAAARRELAIRRRDPALQPLLGDDRRALLDRVARLCDVAAEHWGDVCRDCAVSPRVLAHSDFVPRNLRVLHGAGREKDGAGPAAALFAFDWEDAAWAPPAVDLSWEAVEGPCDADECDAANPDPETYCRAVAARWPGMTPETFRRLGEVCRVLLTVRAVREDAEAIDEDWLDKPLWNMRIYARELAEAAAALDWDVGSQ